MSQRTCLTVVLAAGEGTRMKSSLPKVLHEVAGLPMVAHAVRTARQTQDVDIALVVGREAEKVRKVAEPFAPGVEAFVQAERLGTAHAVLAARDALGRGYDDIIVMYGDTPLVRAEVLAELRAETAAGASVAVMGFRTSDPTGYGRLLMGEGRLAAIREERDCTEEERRVDFCNSGLMAIDGSAALSLLQAVGDNNTKREFYLTDIVEIANARGLKVTAIEAAAENALGVNNRVELAEAEALWQRRRRREAMLDGVSMAAPETVHFSYDTEVARDVSIEPNVVFGPGVRIASGARIRAFSHIEGAVIAADAEIGPFARLRPGADIGSHAKVGNFCEVKNAVVGDGAKVNHLSYVGDAEIGAKANIGAGTITCNYDGFLKHRTTIGAGAFIGSNSALVAPLTIGDDAYVASGSVITADVEAEALAFGRARQENKPGFGRRLREKLQALKAARAAKSA